MQLKHDTFLFLRLTLLSISEFSGPGNALQDGKTLESITKNSKFFFTSVGSQSKSIFTTTAAIMSVPPTSARLLQRTYCIPIAIN